mmetsp:Transcript_917/g.2824  ORF Transcript_917/g.2824 Transcript_917/m.2824 type:complete len:209 (-) Transcript_917:707-1333(-)
MAFGARPAAAVGYTLPGSTRAGCRAAVVLRGGAPARSRFTRASWRMRGSIGSPQEVIHAFHGAGMSLRCRAGQHGAAPGNSFSSVPVLDLSLLERSDTRTEFLELLRDTCHTVGFMYVVNHGVPLETLDGALQASQEFFALPEEEKMQIHHSKSAAFRGYIATKAENTGGQPDLREQVPTCGRQTARCLASEVAWSHTAMACTACLRR